MAARAHFTLGVVPSKHEIDSTAPPIIINRARRGQATVLQKGVKLRHLTD
jgi:hypothetical protein